MVQIWEVATGKERCRFVGHGGEIVSLAFSPDNATLVTGSADTSLLVWDLAGNPLTDDSPKALEKLWGDLAVEDAAQAYRAVQTLAQAPEKTIAFFKKHVCPAREVDVEQMARLMKDLDSDEFAVRERATGELDKLGPAADPLLEKALKGPLTIEAKRRIQQSLGKLRGGAEHFQTLRALEVLEHVDTPDSRQLLAQLAAGAPDAWLTKEAKAITRRLAAKEH
jgi:hypothetical protein